ncbi:smad nuclear interacting protein, putative [Rhizoctonia solani AG-3 Rhs1AP]|uniref:Smad nuclear interacting protein, putative n=2 Tax=Rhizoctonia solani AG-3 TaxID=1086053 RepID=X8J6X7_9AGAM|nr:smad nuclear interacting protein, putative [Rhizoctonia solani AG-3 Rhs1AP]KEP54775.1 putative smad nuclear interacting protein [Rhizoctonia solani 123E]
MPRRSLSPRRNSPPRRSRRSPDSDRNRERDREYREDKYSRDSRPRSSRDDRRDYGRGRDRSREDRRRDRREKDPRRDEDERGGSQRGERQSDSRPPGPDSPNQRRSPSPPEEDKAKPNFGNSGLLAAATNTVKHGDGTSTLLKYNEPPEARKPVENWRLYVFKGQEQVDLLHLHRQSAYLIGRDAKICDITVEHPSCSKQHAVIQFRQIHVKDEFGAAKAVVKPFVIDLESTNGTMVNDDPIPVSRYYELKPSDVVKFGESTREYVLLHDNAL